MCGIAKLIVCMIISTYYLSASEKVRDLFTTLNTATKSRSQHVLRSATQEMLDATLWGVLYDTSVVPHDCLKICKQLLRYGANPNYEVEIECTSFILALQRCIDAYTKNDKHYFKNLDALIKLLLQHGAQPTEAMLIIIEQTLGSKSSIYKNLTHRKSCY